jgi:23S rRNA pseudouridine2605 synthase
MKSNKKPSFKKQTKPNNSKNKQSKTSSFKFKNGKNETSQLTKKKKNDELIRLNRFLSSAGICSRREADEFIKAGVVKVNGKIVTELGTKISPTDEVRFNEQIVRIEKKVYILLNKPKDYITTTSDERRRKTVMQLIKGACCEKVFPVGRLDRNTTGVLLLTNDGELTAKLTHPKYKRKKIYHVFLDKNLKKHDMEKLVEGIKEKEDILRADVVSYVDPSDKSQVGVEIHTGQNRVIRRMFEALGYKVIKLDRVYFAGLTKKGLPRGHWRYLTPAEVNMLKMGAFE